jgi:hypothetical protein
MGRFGHAIPPDLYCSAIVKLGPGFLPTTSKIWLNDFVTGFTTILPVIGMKFKPKRLIQGKIITFGLIWHDF